MAPTVRTVMNPDHREHHELHSSTARISRTHVSSVTVQREDTQAIPHGDVPLNLVCTVLFMKARTRKRRNSVYIRRPRLAMTCMGTFAMAAL